MKKDNKHVIHTESFSTFSYGSILLPDINRGMVSEGANTWFQDCYFLWVLMSQDQLITSKLFTKKVSEEGHHREGNHITVHWQRNRRHRVNLI